MNLADQTWSCVPSPNADELPVDDAPASRSLVCPVGGIQFCSDSTRAPVPDDDPVGNPLGSCHCDGEVWLSTGCSYGFVCDSSLPEGGTYTPCGEVRKKYHHIMRVRATGPNG